MPLTVTCGKTTIPHRQAKADVQAVIDRVEDAIAAFEQVDAGHRRAFAVHVLFKRRPW